MRHWRDRLLTCELRTRRFTRTELDGTVRVPADGFDGTRLTGDNDVIVKSDGSIWFSDNGAGIRGHYLGDKAPQELPFRVYRIDAAGGEMTVAIGDMERPNRLCFSLDESGLYVVDTPSGRRTTHVCDLAEDGGTARNGRVFFDATPGYADGVGCDAGQRLVGLRRGRRTGRSRRVRPGRYPDRAHLAGGALRQPVLRGGPKRNRLFMTASQPVYAVFVEAQSVLGG